MAVRLVVTFPRGVRQGRRTRAGDEGALRGLAAGCRLANSLRCSRASPIPTSWSCSNYGRNQAALDAHAKLQAQRPPLPEGLRLGAGEREDYTYKRTR